MKISDVTAGLEAVTEYSDRTVQDLADRILADEGGGSFAEAGGSALNMVLASTPVSKRPAMGARAHALALAVGIEIGLKIAEAKGGEN